MKQWQDGKSRYVTSFKVLENEDARILLLEYFSCANKSELNAREALHIRTKDCVNKVVPGRTGAEYRQDNHEMILEKKRMKKHCETCNCYVRHGDFLKHSSTKKHHSMSDTDDEIDLLADSASQLVLDNVGNEASELVGI
jgi:hypothetical protein